MQITKKEAEKFVAAYNKHFGNAVLAGAEFGLTREAFKRRLAYAKDQHGLRPKDFTVIERYARVTVSPEQTDAVNLAKERAAHSLAKDRLKQASDEIAHLEKQLSNYAFASKASASPADWTLKTRQGKKTEHMPVLLVSDAQIGEVIDPTETEYGRGYSTPIFRERYRELISTTIHLATTHNSESWTYPGIIYIRGGDTISGAIHQELAETDDTTPLEGVQVAFEEEAAGIAHLADAFGKVEVKSVSGGNHDRNTLKRQSKKRVQHSYDSLVDFMLAHHFRNDKRITFQLTKSPDVVFPIYGFNALATHGDNIGSGGGTGFIGPVANIAKGVQKIIMEQQALGRRIDHTFLGHFHVFHHCSVFTANGSFPGYSEFAKSFRMRPEPPMQSLQFWHEKHGCVSIRAVKLK